MKDITYTITSSTKELQQILQLQKTNLPVSISKTEKEREGFVTVEHDLDILKKMHDRQPHIIAKHEDHVIGYALSMVKDFKDQIPVLQPMFLKIDEELQGKSSYLVMGQICIDKAYRKQGIFRGLYTKMRDELNTKYDLLITEVAASNARSLNAHYAIGFKDLMIYEDNTTKWHLIYWNWE